MTDVQRDAQRLLLAARTARETTVDWSTEATAWIETWRALGMRIALASADGRTVRDTLTTDRKV